MKPLNNHLQIEPINSIEFVQTERTAYEEIGKVLAVANGVTGVAMGDVVYFDAWLAKKYPVTGEPGKYNWFVKYDDVVAYVPLSK